MKVWTTLSDDHIYDIANALGIAIASQQSTNRTRTPLDWVGRARVFGLRPDSGMRDEDGNCRYQRISASPFGYGRRVHAVCWHGHRDFMAEIFDADPNARIKTYVADYKGRDDFLDKYPDTAYRNIGAPIMPVMMAEACTC